MRSKSTCSIDDCDRSHYARGWCDTHYQRWRYHGDPHGGAPAQGPELDCSIDGCVKPYYGRGWCHAHYERWRLHGDPMGGGPHLAFRPRGISIAEWFWSKVEFTDTCWLWTGAKNNKGYGVFNVNGGKMYAHRWAYEFCVGPIPAGLELDHLCRVPLCLRSDHLEPVTHRVNVQRAHAFR